MTIGEMSTPLESFAKTHKVIAVELQGHGRTASRTGERWTFSIALQLGPSSRSNHSAKTAASNRR
jgi:hypothetical protein